MEPQDEGPRPKLSDELDELFADEDGGGGSGAAAGAAVAAREARVAQLGSAATASGGSSSAEAPEQTPKVKRRPIRKFKRPSAQLKGSGESNAPEPAPAPAAQQPLHTAASVATFVAIPDGSLVDADAASMLDGQARQALDAQVAELGPALQRFFDAASRIASVAAGDALPELWKRLHARWGKERLRQALAAPVSSAGAGAGAGGAAAAENLVLQDGSAVITSSLGYRETPADRRSMQGSSMLALIRSLNPEGMGGKTDEELREIIEANQPARHVPATAPRPNAYSSPLSRFDAATPTERVDDPSGSLLGCAAASVATAMPAAEAQEVATQLSGTPAGAALQAALVPPQLRAVREARCEVTSVCVDWK